MLFVTHEKSVTVKVIYSCCFWNCFILMTSKCFVTVAWVTGSIKYVPIVPQCSLLEDQPNLQRLWRRKWYHNANVCCSADVLI